MKLVQKEAHNKSTMCSLYSSLTCCSLFTSWRTCTKCDIHDIGVWKSIEKSYFFEEKFLLALVKDMQHFLDSHCFDIFLSSIFCGVHIAKSTLTEPLFNLQSVTIKDLRSRYFPQKIVAFFKNWGSLKCRKNDILDARMHVKVIT